MRREVFKCQLCGDCCRGEGGIFIRPEDADGPAEILGLSPEEFIRAYTEPRHGLLSLKIDQDGFCLLHDREKHTCRIHQAKPRMCRDWPFFWGMLNDAQGFEDARQACPGFLKDVTWEEFLDWHREHVGEWPPRTYLFPDKTKKLSIKN